MDAGRTTREENWGRKENLLANISAGSSVSFFIILTFPLAVLWMSSACIGSSSENGSGPLPPATAQGRWPIKMYSVVGGHTCRPRIPQRWTFAACVGARLSCALQTGEAQSNAACVAPGRMVSPAVLVTDGELARGEFSRSLTSFWIWALTACTVVTLSTK
jgi:hypothetical protein